MTASPPSVPLAISAAGITKRYPGIYACREVHLAVERGSIHAVVGENGAGKSTLLNILYGRVQPSAGSIQFNGADVSASLRGPADAIRLGIGLVTQHYSLIGALSVEENLILGAEPVSAGIISQSRARRRLADLASDLGLGEVDPRTPVAQLSIAAQQKVEILKALYRDAKILLLDEPTAALAPAEADALFRLLRLLRSSGVTIVLVTHKLREVTANADAVTVLRAGRNAGDFRVGDVGEREILARMVGAEPTLPGTQPRRASPVRSQSEESPPALLIHGLTADGEHGRDTLRGVSIEVRAGEIVGVAGVDGSGQQELAEAVVGIRTASTGTIELAGARVERLSVRDRAHHGIAYVPADRHRDALVLDFSVVENFLLGHEFDAAWGGGALLRPAVAQARAKEVMNRYDVRAGVDALRASVQALSGGNQQKLVLARALESRPRLLVACQPTRGLDVAATQAVHARLRELRSAGAGILLFSLDLDEIRELSDRIAVLFNGAVAGTLARGDASLDRLSALMTGVG